MFPSFLHPPLLLPLFLVLILMIHSSPSSSTYALVLLSLLSLLATARCGDSGIPVATEYRAFGPLPIGSRGGNPFTVLGDDVLTVLSTVDRFPSECATGGSATWRQSEPYNTTTAGVVTIPFGDAELPYESYAIANFTPPARTQTELPQVLRCLNPALIRSTVDDANGVAKNTDVHCAADIYEDGRALCPITLTPGVRYTILIHLSSRANTSSLSCNYFYPPEDNGLARSLLIPLNDSVAPSIVVENPTVTTPNHSKSHPSSPSVAHLAGPHCSVTVLNGHDDAWATGGRAKIVDAPVGLSLVPHSSDEHYPLPRLAPRQIRQLRLDLNVDHTATFQTTEVYVVIEVKYEIGTGSIHKTRFNISLPIVTWGQDRAYHFTYIDVDSSVQAAAVLPPAAACAPNCNVLLSTHGAGVDAVGVAWTNSYRTQTHAWVLLPTGRRKFGLNWEGPQMRTAITALRVLEATLPGVPAAVADEWRPRKDTWLQAGHSMGGHGALLLSTHFPDMLTAALPAMGWLRLSTYGGAADSEDLSYSDASLRALLSVASAEYNADLYAENLLGIPFLARVGADDDNVPRK